MSTRRNLLGALYLIAQPLLLNALAVPATALIIRSLGPTEYGQWAVSTSLIAVAIVLTNLGLRTLFVRAVAQDPSSAAAAFAEQLPLRILLALLAGAVSLGTCAALRYPMVVVECTAVAVAGMALTVILSAAADVLQ